MIEHFKRKLPQLLILLFVLVSVSACSVVDNFIDTKRSNLDYKNNRTVKSLDFPPDLTAPEFDNAFVLPADGMVSASSLSGRQYGNSLTNGQKVDVLPKSSIVHSGGVGNVRWLDVNESAETLWPKLREFWRSVGIVIKRDEPRIGLIETEWAEKRAGLPMDWLRKATGSLFQSGFDAGVRDRYRMRLEKTSDKTTRVYLTHKGAEQVRADSITGWELRPANSELEAEMLNRLKAYIQGDIAAATGKTKRSLPASSRTAVQTSSLASLVEQEGQSILQIHDNYKRAWVLTGIMMDRMGLVVEKRNQAAGIYHVKYHGDDESTAKRGFFSRVFGGRRVTILIKEEDYQVHIQDAGKLSVVRITDDEGKPLNKRQTHVALARLKKEFDR